MQLVKLSANVDNLLTLVEHDEQSSSTMNPCELIHFKIVLFAG